MPGRFALRVYLYGVLMIALAAGASFLVGRYSLRPALDGPARPSSTWIAWRMCELADHPEELKAALTDIRKRVGIDLAVYDVNVQLIASNSTPPEPGVKGEDLTRLRRERNVFGRGWGQVMEHSSVGHTPRYAVLRYRSPEWPISLL